MKRAIAFMLLGLCVFLNAQAQFDKGNVEQN